MSVLIDLIMKLSFIAIVCDLLILDLIFVVATAGTHAQPLYVPASRKTFFEEATGMTFGEYLAKADAYAHAHALSAGNEQAKLSLQTELEPAAKSQHAQAGSESERQKLLGESKKKI
jgi:hypothetical protein